MSSANTKFLVSVVVSSDWFIADSDGYLSFSSLEDKKFLRDMMLGDKTDCFIIGRKTYETMQGRINKPYIVLSREEKKVEKNRIFTSFADMIQVLTKRNLCKPIVLGGNETYLTFFKGNYNLEIKVVIEKNIQLLDGKKFIISKKEIKHLMTKQENISENTVVITYKRPRRAF